MPHSSISILRSRSLLESVRNALPVELEDALQSFSVALGLPLDAIRFVCQEMASTAPLDLNGVTVGHLLSTAILSPAQRHHISVLALPAIVELAAKELISTFVNEEAFPLSAILDELSWIIACVVPLEGCYFSRVSPTRNLEERCWTLLSGEEKNRLIQLDLHHTSAEVSDSLGYLTFWIKRSGELIGRLAIKVKDAQTISPCIRRYLEILADTLGATLHERRERRANRLFQGIEEELAKEVSPFSRLAVMLNTCCEFLECQAADIQSPMDKSADIAQVDVLKVAARWPGYLDIPMTMLNRSYGDGINPAIQRDWPTTHPGERERFTRHLEKHYKPQYHERLLSTIESYPSLIQFPLKRGHIVEGMATFYSTSTSYAPNLGYISVVQRLASRFVSEMASVDSTQDDVLKRLKLGIPAQEAPFRVNNTRSTDARLRYQELTKDALRVSGGFRATVFLQESSKSVDLVRYAFSDPTTWPKAFRESENYSLPLSSDATLVSAHKLGKTIFFQDVRVCKSTYYPLDDAHDDRVCSCVAVPIRLGNQGVAVLYVDWDNPANANPVSVWLLEDMAHRYATLIAGDELTKGQLRHSQSLIDLVRTFQQRVGANAAKLLLTRPAHSAIEHYLDELDDEVQIESIQHADMHGLLGTTECAGYSVVLWEDAVFEGLRVIDVPPEAVSEALAGTSVRSKLRGAFGLLQLSFSERLENPTDFFDQTYVKQYIAEITNFIQQRTSELHTSNLRRFYSTLSRELRPEQVVAHFFSFLNDYFGACAPFIRLHDTICEGDGAPEEMLCLLAADSKPENAWVNNHPPRVGMGAGIAGKCFESTDSPVLYVPFVHEELMTREFAIRNLARLCGAVGSLLAVRFDDGAIKGTLHVHSTAEDAFSIADIRLVNELSQSLAEKLAAAYERLDRRVSESIDKVVEGYTRDAFQADYSLPNGIQDGEALPGQQFWTGLLDAITGIAVDCDAWIRVLDERKGVYLLQTHRLSAGCPFGPKDVPDHKLSHVQSLMGQKDVRAFMFSGNDQTIREALHAWEEKFQPYFSNKQLFYAIVQPSSFESCLLSLVVPESSYLRSSVVNSLGNKLKDVQLRLKMTEERRECAATQSIEVVGGLLELTMHGLNHSFSTVQNCLATIERFTMDQQELRKYIGYVTDELAKHSSELHAFSVRLIHATESKSNVNVLDCIKTAVRETLASDRSYEGSWVSFGECDDSVAVHGYQTQLTGAIRLVLMNAFKFSKMVAKDRTPEIRIAVINLEGRYVRISVSDNGVGMQSSEQEQQGHGRGSGLLAARALVRHNKGRIPPGRDLAPGAEFRILLPYGVAE